MVAMYKSRKLFDNQIGLMPISSGVLVFHCSLESPVYILGHVFINVLAYGGLLFAKTLKFGTKE